MVNAIYLMVEVLQHHTPVDFISETTKNKTEDKPPKDQGMGIVLNTITSSFDRCILDSSSLGNMFT